MDAEALKEIDRQVKRVEAKKLRMRFFLQRRIVKDGECLKRQEHIARLRFEEKVRNLLAMAIE